MRTTIKVLVATLVALFTTFAAAIDSRLDFGTFTTYNYHPYAMWVTIYDVTKTRHLDYGCVPAGEAPRHWKAGQYLWGSIYYVRAEVKKGLDCSGPLICDTTMQVTADNPDTNASLFREPGNPGPVVTLYPNETNVNGCYLDQRFNMYKLLMQVKDSPAWMVVRQERADIDTCSTDNDNQAGQARSQFAAAERAGKISGAEMDAFNLADKQMKARNEKYKKDKEGLTLAECKLIKEEIGVMKADVARMMKTGAATATVTPAHLTVKSGGNGNFTVRCSSGDPTVGFQPPAGGVGPNGGGVFTFFSDSRKPPGEHVGVIKCGMTTVTTKLPLTVTK